MFPMGGTHLVELGFQLAHVPLHFLDGGSIGKDKEKRFKIPILHISALRHIGWWKKRRTLQSTRSHYTLFSALALFSIV